VAVQGRLPANLLAWFWLPQLRLVQDLVPVGPEEQLAVWNMPDKTTPLLSWIACGCRPPQVVFSFATGIVVGKEYEFRARARNGVVRWAGQV